MQADYGKLCLKEAEQAHRDMTARKDYERLEAAGLWREGPDSQRRDVIVSIGDASLVITDINDVALAHWSLPAVMRANPGKSPAVFFPDGDPDETLELDETEADMITAIETLRSALARHAPHPGRIRLVSFLALTAAVLVLAATWLPDALLRHALSIVPDAKRVEIGTRLLAETRRLTGAACSGPSADRALALLRQRLGTGPLYVVPSGVATTLALPGGTLLIGRQLVEDYDAPDVVAGFVVAETVRSGQEDPLARVLSDAGPVATFRLLTTGQLPDAALRSYAESAVAQRHGRIDPARLLPAFEAAELRIEPYARALDVTGETTLPLIETDPFLSETARTVIPDGAWVALQEICGA